MEGDGPALAVLSEKQLQTVVRTYAESDAPIEQFRDVSDLLRRMDIADDVVSAEDVARVGWDEASGVRMDCDTFIRVVRLCKAKVVGVVRSEDTDNREMMEGLLLDDPNELPVEWIAGILGTMDINARLPAHDGKISRATLERFLCTTPLYAAEEVVFTPGVGGDSPDADPCSSADLNSPASPPEPLKAPEGEASRRTRFSYMMQTPLDGGRRPSGASEFFKYRVTQLMQMVNTPWYSGVKERARDDRVRRLTQLSDPDVPGGKQGRRLYILKELTREAMHTPRYGGGNSFAMLEKLDLELQLLRDLLRDDDPAPDTGGKAAPKATPAPSEPLDLRSSERDVDLAPDSPAAAPSSTAALAAQIASMQTHPGCKGRLNCTLGGNRHQHRGTPTPADVLKSPPIPASLSPKASPLAPLRGVSPGFDREGSSGSGSRGSPSGGSLPVLREPLWSPKQRGVEAVGKCCHRAGCGLTHGAETLAPIEGDRGVYIAPASPPFSPPRSILEATERDGKPSRNRLRKLPRDGGPHAKRSEKQRRVLNFNRALKTFERGDAGPPEPLPHLARSGTFRPCNLTLWSRGTSFTNAVTSMQQA
eukprot:TRINITY_DN2769_c1_g2_i1.p1 TRINITY_DN2769_c1_g2~~TRINITY_DN2769_c1_g2_i1.p1  ORF type:complete len:591 (+),score=164.17 TRINITY_DN2769_c1_g2_i1:205-1977(+)